MATSMKPKTHPTPMFPSGTDLPLFSMTPVKAQESHYHPTPANQQGGLFKTACPICQDTRNFKGQPCPMCNKLK